MEGGAKIRAEIEFVGRDDAPPLHSRISTLERDFNREVTHCSRDFSRV